MSFRGFAAFGTPQRTELAPGTKLAGLAADFLGPVPGLMGLEREIGARLAAAVGWW